MQPPICCIEYQGKIKTYCAVGELNEHMHKFINDFFYNSQSHYCACFFFFTQTDSSTLYERYYIVLRKMSMEKAFELQQSALTYFCIR